MRALFIAVLIFLSGCGSQETVTSRSPYSKSEVFDLEIRAIRNDVEAMQQLQEHYSFEGKRDEWQKLHVKLLELNDPDALHHEAMHFLLAADKVKDGKEKLNLLNKSLEFAKKEARVEGVKDISRHNMVILVQKDLNKLNLEK